MRFLTVFLTMGLFATPALAHGGGASGFVAGLLHPLGGLDHILAMLAVGLFVARIGGRALWLVPAAFLAMLGLGAVLGVSGVAIPMVETVIVLSIVAIGALLALRRSVPVAIAAAMVGAFAAFHGHAHGVEIPASVSAIGYGTGLLTATLLLGGAGLAAGVMADRLGAQSGPKLARASGAALAATGLLMLASGF